MQMNGWMNDDNLFYDYEDFLPDLCLFFSFLFYFLFACLKRIYLSKFSFFLLLFFLLFLLLKQQQQQEKKYKHIYLNFWLQFQFSFVFFSLFFFSTFLSSFFSFFSGFRKSERKRVVCLFVLTSYSVINESRPILEFITLLYSYFTSFSYSFLLCFVVVANLIERFTKCAILINESNR